MNEECTLQDIANELSNIEQAIIIESKNDFGNTVGDELHQIEYQLSRIADALVKIAKK